MKTNPLAFYIAGARRGPWRSLHIGRPRSGQPDVHEITTCTRYALAMVDSGSHKAQQLCEKQPRPGC